MAVEDGPDESFEDALFNAMASLRAALTSVQYAFTLENVPPHRMQDVSNAIRAAYYAVERELSRSTDTYTTGT